MSNQAYMIIWGVYLFAVAGFLLLTWHWLRKLVGRFSVLLVLPLFALLVTPANVEQGNAMRAPAFVVALFEQMQGIGEGWTRAGVPLLLAVVGALLIAIIVVVLLFLRKRKKLSKDKAKNN